MAVAIPVELVLTVVVFVLLANLPLAPDAGAVNVTGTFGTGLLPASLTVTTRELAKAVFTGALWLLPPVIVMVAGTWVTWTVSVLDEAEEEAPPPDADAEFVTLVGDAAGTFTVSASGGKLEVAVTTLEFVQLIAFVPLQDQFVPVPDARV